MGRGEAPGAMSLLPPEVAARRVGFPSSCARRSDDIEARRRIGRLQPREGVAKRVGRKPGSGGERSGPALRSDGLRNSLRKPPLPDLEPSAFVNRRPSAVEALTPEDPRDCVISM